MDKTRILFGIITAVVVILAVLVHYQYLMVQKEKYTLEQNLNKATREKENLSSELEQSKIDLHNKTDELDKITEKLGSLEKEAEAVKSKLSETTAMIDKAKAEAAADEAEKTKLNTELNSLKKDYEALKTQFDSVNQAKVVLEENLHSKTFLKEALKRLKAEKYPPKAQGQKIKQAGAKIDRDVKYGNRGFIIKDAKPTYPRNVKVEVLPAE